MQPHNPGWIVFFAVSCAAICIAPQARAEPDATNRMDLFLTDGGTIEFAWVPAGQFSMGSKKGDDDEQPARRVTLTRGFWMGKYEITQRQYEHVTGHNPSTFKHPDHPVEFISFQELTKFFEEFPRRAKLPDDLVVRLPTEAEWEFACRAGGSGTVPELPTADELRERAWFAANSQGSTAPVGQKLPNDLGLYDMLGNVSEWCSDWYLERFYKISTQETNPKGPFAGASKVVRGGSWRNSAPYCRPANRFQYRIFSKDYSVGFRIVLVAR